MSFIAPAARTGAARAGLSGRISTRYARRAITCHDQTSFCSVGVSSRRPALQTQSFSLSFAGSRRLDQKSLCSDGISTGRGQTRSFSFSFAGPRKLDEIMKLEVIKDKSLSSTDVQDIWLGYHESKERQEGIVIGGKICKSILARAAQCPFFVQPIFRDDGFFTLISQFQTPSHFLLAYLEDYKMDPAAAQPLISFSVFDDLVDSLDIGLVRVDIINKGIEDDEGLRCVNSLLDAYGKDDEFLNVHAFNKKPEGFDFDDYVSQQNQKWKEQQEQKNGD